MSADLVAYAAQCIRNQGMTPEQVREHLRNEGYDEAQITAALEGAEVLGEQPEPRLEPRPGPNLVPIVAGVVVFILVFVLLRSFMGGTDQPVAVPTPTLEPTSRATSTPVPQATVEATPAPPAGMVELVGVEVRAKEDGQYVHRDFTMDAVKQVYGILSAPNSTIRLHRVQAFVGFCKATNYTSPALQQGLGSLDKAFESYEFYLSTNNVPKASEVLTNDIFGSFHARRVEGPLPVIVSLGFGNSVVMNLTSATAELGRNTIWETSHLILPTITEVWEENLPIEQTAAELGIDVLYLERDAIDIQDVRAPSFTHYNASGREPLAGEGFSFTSFEDVVEYELGGEVCTKVTRRWSAGSAGDLRCVQREKEGVFFTNRTVHFAFIDLTPVLANLTGVYRADLVTSIGGVDLNFTFLFLEARTPFTKEDATGLVSSLGMGLYEARTEGTEACPIHVVGAFTTATTPIYYMAGVTVGQYMMVMSADDKPNPRYLLDMAEATCA